MDAQTIVATVRSGNVPHDWNVWPLNVQRVRRGLLGWVGIAVLGWVLLIPVAIMTIPSNFEHGALGIVFTLVLLGILAGLAFGGLGIAIYDVWRLAHADEFYIIMTPDDFVKVEPRRIVHVPMEHVQFITLRGQQTEQERTAQEMRALGSRAGFGGPVGSLRIVPYMRPRQPKQAPSLAFVDARGDSVVVVATDDSFENLYVLEQILSDHASAKQRRRMA